MNSNDSLEVTELVAELWPGTPLRGMRATVYAAALCAIPDKAAATSAVLDLAVTERFQPTSGEVIDRAMGLTDRAEAEWQRLVATATDLKAGRPTDASAVDSMARRVLARRWRVIDLPIDDDRRLDRCRAWFVDAYRDHLRQHLARPALAASVTSATAGELTRG